MVKDIIAEVEAILKTVPNIGQTHTYERWVESEADFRQLFLTAEGGQVLGWTITREATASQDRNVHNVHRNHQLVLRGYMGLQDKVKTEETFQELIETIFTTFLPKRNLNGKAYYSDPIQVRAVQHRKFGGVLCHYCELMLAVQEFPVIF